jgi:hypothetical protein
MIMRLIRLRRALMLLVAITATASPLLAANQKVKYSSSNSWLTGVSVPNTSRVSAHPGDMVSLNPQPLPPKTAFSKVSFGSSVSLNPQPLSPRIGNATNFGRQW